MAQWLHFFVLVLMKILSILISIFSLLVVFPAHAEPQGQELASLSPIEKDVQVLLEEVILLKNETRGLRQSVSELSSNLEAAQRKLKKVSVASTTARGYLKLIKQLGPELKLCSEQLSQKEEELKVKLVRLDAIANNIILPENDLEKELLKIFSESSS
ncbi:MAG: hypothetical protein A2W61_01145 [Deltaproteobacteria bacterium RIFCSPLOWO2_01_44_7]|nr:MAG: hypothetical protein A2712_03935 [Deltaproteobacteria bacterium RIFCSPHIGHO2_01_FULL_43_49]OGQ38526.1 MAG: hypothetical protein A2W61_01145 [Deltaproteobacteria bacterium RIFCSPLOWO2_01_44_7]